MSEFYVAGIDLGNTKVVGGVARKNDNGSLTLLAVEQDTPKNNCVEKGSIKSINDAAMAITTMVKMLCNAGSVKDINHVYVTWPNQTADPSDFITQIQHKLKNSYHLIAPTISVAELIANKYATPRERETGCLTIDFGHTSTSYAYIDESLTKKRGMVTAGSHHITTDLMQLFDYEEKIAHQLKIKMVKASMAQEIDQLIDLGNGRSIKMSDLSGKVMERVDDILKRVLVYMAQNQWHSNMDRIIILSGGGSNLKNLDKYLHQRTGLRVKFAEQSDDCSMLSTNVNIESYRYAALMGLLNYATQACDEKIPKKPSLFGKFIKKGTETTKGLFDSKDSEDEKF